MRAPLFAVLLSLSIAASSASAQSVDVGADSREIYAGLPFSLVVEAADYDEDPEPAAPDLAIAGCSVVFVGASPRVMRQTTVVNGRRTDSVQVTFSYRYQVTPSAAGTYSIPAIEVVQGTKKAVSQPRTFEAKSVERTTEMALRVVMPDRGVWLGETFEVTIDWYLVSNPSRPAFGIPIFGAIDWVSVKPAEEGASRRSLTFSAGKEELELAYAQDKAQLDGKPYTRFRFRALLTPLKAGTLELPAARVVAALEVGQGRDRFGFAVARSEIFEAIDSPRSLEIKPLPQAGRPPGFKNAVGTGFSIDVQASRTVVRVGDPIELTVTVKSDSRLAGMALPDMSVLLDPNHFAVGDEEPVGELADDGKTKVFRVTAQLKSSDAREIPPLALAYFNPKAGTYESARSQPIALQVAGSAMVGAAQVTRSAGDSAPPAAGKNVSLVGANLALSSRATTDSQPLTTASLAPLLAGLYIIPCLFFAVLFYRRRTEGTRAARGAKKRRVGAFEQALASAPTGFARESASALAAALREMKKKSGASPGDFDQLIADLDAEAYNPRSGQAPLASQIVARCRDVGAALTAGLALVLALTFAPDIAAAQTADQARALYQQAIASGDEVAARSDFARAAAGFAEAAAAGPGRPELLVDWGNAALGARDLGTAVLAYRRALELDRSNPRARTNLAWVRGSLPSWAPKPTDRGALASLFFWHAEWSLARRHLVAAIAFALAVLIMVPWRRRPALARYAAAAVLFAVCLAMLVSVLLDRDVSRDAVVVRDAEILRAADSPGAAAVLASPLPAGLEVTILESRDRWRHIELADGQRGWLPTAAIEPVAL